jgi:hypothetical protein
MNQRQSSAYRLREMLALYHAPTRMYEMDVLYHVQIDYTCQLLDVVDEVTDPVTAALVTDRIYGRLTGDGVGEVERRIRDAQDQLARMMREPFRLFPEDGSET